MEVERNVRRYNKCLEQLVDQHHMFRIIADINDMANIAPETTIKAAFNTWDTQLVELQKALRRKVLERDSSPIFSFWLSRVRLWRKAKDHKLDPLSDITQPLPQSEGAGLPQA